MSLPNWSDIKGDPRFGALPPESKVKMYDAWESRATALLRSTPEGAANALQLKAFGGRVRSGLMGEQLEPAKADDVFQSYLQSTAATQQEQGSRVEEISRRDSMRDQLIGAYRQLDGLKGRLSQEERDKMVGLRSRMDELGIDPDDMGVVDKVLSMGGKAVSWVTSLANREGILLPRLVGLPGLGEVADQTILANKAKRERDAAVDQLRLIDKGLNDYSTMELSPGAKDDEAAIRQYMAESAALGKPKVSGAASYGDVVNASGRLLIADYDEYREAIEALPISEDAKLLRLANFKEDQEVAVSTFKPVLESIPHYQKFREENADLSDAEAMDKYYQEGDVPFLTELAAANIGAFKVGTQSIADMAATFFNDLNLRSDEKYVQQLEDGAKLRAQVENYHGFFGDDTFIMGMTVPQITGEFVKAGVEMAPTIAAAALTRGASLRAGKGAAPDVIARIARATDAAMRGMIAGGGYYQSKALTAGAVFERYKGQMEAMEGVAFEDMDEEQQLRVRMNALQFARHHAHLSGVSTAVISSLFGVTGAERIANVGSKATREAVAKALDHTYSQAALMGQKMGLAGAVATGRGVLGRATRGAIEEGIEEFADEFIQGVQERTLINPSMGDGELLAQAVFGAFIGSGLGAVSGGATGGIERYQTVRSIRDTAESNTKEELEGLVVNARRRLDEINTNLRDAEMTGSERRTANISLKIALDELNKYEAAIAVKDRLVPGGISEDTKVAAEAIGGVVADATAKIDEELQKSTTRAAAEVAREKGIVDDGKRIAIEDEIAQLEEDRELADEDEAEAIDRSIANLREQLADLGEAPPEMQGEAPPETPAVASAAEGVAPEGEEVIDNAVVAKLRERVEKSKPNYRNQKVAFESIDDRAIYSAEAAIRKGTRSGAGYENATTVLGPSEDQIVSAKKEINLALKERSASSSGDTIQLPTVFRPAQGQAEREPAGQQAEQAQPASDALINLKQNGTPFKRRQDAQSAGRRNGEPNPIIVEVGDGFGWQVSVADDTLPQDTEGGDAATGAGGAAPVAAGVVPGIKAVSYFHDRREAGASKEVATNDLRLALQSIDEGALRASISNSPFIQQYFQQGQIDSFPIEEVIDAVVNGVATSKREDSAGEVGDEVDVATMAENFPKETGAEQQQEGGVDEEAEQAQTSEQAEAEEEADVLDDEEAPSQEAADADPELQAVVAAAGAEAAEDQAEEPAVAPMERTRADAPTSPPEVEVEQVPSDVDEQAMRAAIEQDGRTPKEPVIQDMLASLRGDKAAHGRLIPKLKGWVKSYAIRTMGDSRPLHLFDAGDMEAGRFLAPAGRPMTSVQLAQLNSAGESLKDVAKGKRKPWLAGAVNVAISSGDLLGAIHLLGQDGVDAMADHADALDILDITLPTEGQMADAPDDVLAANAALIEQLGMKDGGTYSPGAFLGRVANTVGGDVGAWASKLGGILGSWGGVNVIRIVSGDTPPAFRAGSQVVVNIDKAGPDIIGTISAALIEAATLEQLSKSSPVSRDSNVVKFINGISRIMGSVKQTLKVEDPGGFDGYLSDPFSFISGIMSDANFQAFVASRAIPGDTPAMGRIASALANLTNGISPTGITGRMLGGWIDFSGRATSATSPATAIVNRALAPLPTPDGRGVYFPSQRNYSQKAGDNITPGEIDAVVGDLEKFYKDLGMTNVTVVPTKAALLGVDDGAVDALGANDAYGFYSNGQVYVIADRAVRLDAAQLAALGRHESLHRGLANIFAEDKAALSSFFNKVEPIIKGMGALDDGTGGTRTLDSVASLYGGETYDQLSDEGKMEVVEEMLAMMAEIPPAQKGKIADLFSSAYRKLVGKKKVTLPAWLAGDIKGDIGQRGLWQIVHDAARMGMRQAGREADGSDTTDDAFAGDAIESAMGDLAMAGVANLPDGTTISIQAVGDEFYVRRVADGQREMVDGTMSPSIEDAQQKAREYLSGQLAAPAASEEAGVQPAAREMEAKKPTIRIDRSLRDNQGGERGQMEMQARAGRLSPLLMLNERAGLPYDEGQLSLIEEAQIDEVRDWLIQEYNRAVSSETPSPTPSQRKFTANGVEFTHKTEKKLFALRGANYLFITGRNPNGFPFSFLVREEEDATSGLGRMEVGSWMHGTQPRTQDKPDSITYAKWEKVREAVRDWEKRTPVQPPIEPTPRFSRVSPEDVARHAALEAKHNAGTITPEETAEAQGLVEGAARAAGFDVGPVWHGTEQAGLTEIYGGWWSDNKDVTREFGSQQYGAFLRGRLADGDTLRELYIEWNGDDIDPDSDSPLYDSEIGDEAMSGGPFSRFVQSKGFQGIGVWDESNAEVGIAYSVFDPTQIKSADPFTGVPLDRRFDDTSPDIRFSLVSPELEAQWRADHYRTRGRGQTVRTALKRVPIRHPLKPLARALARFESEMLDSDIIKPDGMGEKFTRQFRSYEGYIGAGISGMDVATFIHETAHTLTNDTLMEHVPYPPEEGGPTKDYGARLLAASRDKATPKPIADLIDAYFTVLEHRGEVQLYLGREGIAAYNADDTLDAGGLYGLANMDEFVAEAFSNPDFQRMLRQIPGKKGPSVWAAIIDAVRGILGIEAKHNTMLEQVLDASLSIAAMGQPASGQGRATAAPPRFSRVPPEELEANMAIASVGATQAPPSPGTRPFSASNGRLSPSLPHVGNMMATHGEDAPAALKGAALLALAADDVADRMGEKRLAEMAGDAASGRQAIAEAAWALAHGPDNLAGMWQGDELVRLHAVLSPELQKRWDETGNPYVMLAMATLEYEVNPNQGEDIRFKRVEEDVEDGFYSQLQRGVRAKVPNMATPQQIMATLDPARGGGVKADEIKWSGIEQALQSLAVDGKVGKDALLGYLRDEGRVRFVEISTGDNDSVSRRVEEIEDEYSNLDTEFARTNDPVRREQIQRERQRLIEEQRDIIPTTARFGEHVLPGGENYREVVLAMPSKVPDKIDSMTRQQMGEWYLNEVGYDIAAEEPDMTDAEIRQFIRGYIAEAGGITSAQPIVGSFTSPHFPDIPNYVAHMRLNERTDAEGNEGLFIEEIQSDRHQEGRKKGYREDIESSTNIEEWEAAQTPYDTQEWTVRNKATGQKTLMRASSALEARQLAAQADVQYKQGSLVPDAPFRTTWPLQMFKQALRDAVADGKEWIGWTTGETQNDRFDLRTQIDQLNYSGDVKSGWGLQLLKGGDIIREIDVTDAKLEETVGKDVAGRMRNGVGLIGMGSAGSLEGLNLAVGGDGMAGFYDNILPKEIGKYVKQWGGKVVKGTLPDGTAFWQVDITPEMAGVVEAGQPRFKLVESTADDESSVIGEYGWDPGGLLHRAGPMSKAVYEAKTAMENRIKSTAALFDQIQNAINTALGPTPPREIVDHLGNIYGHHGNWNEAQAQIDAAFREAKRQADADADASYAELAEEGATVEELANGRTRINEAKEFAYEMAREAKRAAEDAEEARIIKEAEERREAGYAALEKWMLGRGKSKEDVRKLFSLIAESIDEKGKLQAGIREVLERDLAMGEEKLKDMTEGTKEPSRKAQQLGAQLDITRRQIAAIDKRGTLYVHRSYMMFDGPQYRQWLLSNAPEARKRIRDAAELIYRMEVEASRNRRTARGVSVEQANRDMQKPAMLESLAKRAEKRLLKYLSIGDASSIDTLFYAKLGEKDDRILRQKDSIPDELLELWGVQKDPRVNMTRTAELMADFLYKDKFLADVLEIGRAESGKKASWLVFGAEAAQERNDAAARAAKAGVATATGVASETGTTLAIPPDQRWEPILKDHDDTARFSPLVGWYAPEYIVRLFRPTLGLADPDIEGGAPKYKAMKSLWKGFKIMTGYQMAKVTIYSPRLAVRNFMSSALPYIVNGNLNITDPSSIMGLVRAAQLALFAGTGGRTTFGLGTPEKRNEARAELRWLSENGIVDDNALIRIMRDLTGAQRKRMTDDLDRIERELAIIQGRSQGMMEFSKGSLSILKRLHKVAESVYQGGDEMWKIGAFYSELDTIRKGYPEKGEDELKLLAADQVKRTQQTYSYVPQFIKQISSAPVFAPFVSFSAISTMMMYNSIAIGLNEVKSGRPPLVKRGLWRLGMMSFFGTAGLGGALAIINGLREMVGDDEEEWDEDDLRHHLRDWEKNAVLMVLKADDGRVRYANISHLDFYSYTGKIAYPLWQSITGQKPPMEGAWQALGAAVDPVNDPQLFFSTAYTMLSGAEPSLFGKEGRRVYSWETDNFPEAGAKLGAYLAEQLLPLWGDLKRPVLAGMGKEIGGVRLNIGTELLNLLAGQRIRDVDIRTTTRQAMAGMSSDWSGIVRSNFTQHLTSNSEKKAGTIRANAERGYRKMARMVEPYESLYESALHFGLSRADLSAIESEAGVPASLRDARRTGRLAPYRPSSPTIQKARAEERALSALLKREQDDRMKALRSANVPVLP